MFDLSTCLSKFLTLGLSIREVVSMGTEGPARILRYEDRGTLRVGALADIAQFGLDEGVFPSYDNTGEMRCGRQLMRNVDTIVGGRVLERRPASPCAVWAEHWDRGGTNARISAFQCELVSKRHTPEQMCTAHQSCLDDEAAESREACVAKHSCILPSGRTACERPDYAGLSAATVHWDRWHSRSWTDRPSAALIGAVRSRCAVGSSPAPFDDALPARYVTCFAA
jgi:hypothetical protein